MQGNGLPARVLRREMLCGAFLKTPAYELVEVLAMSGRRRRGSGMGGAVLRDRPAGPDTRPRGCQVRDAMGRVRAAAIAQGKSAVTFAPDAGTLDDLTALGVNMMFFASEQSWVLQGAKQVVADFRAGTG